MSAVLSGEISGEELGDLFFDSVDTEIKLYQVKLVQQERKSVSAVRQSDQRAIEALMRTLM
ncbi:Secernin-2 [Liparis tanakae]|uniref:Secernin-2 n=1 Tax=Liparis tanakae TaxID=230148 RepID=A0A4Z2ELF9_9TELE|nr:Secernin-2 [Liparis tanakae]